MSIADKLKTIAENEQKVFDAGKQAEYDAFWDIFQQNGNRTSYDRCFEGNYWSNENYNPKYPLKCEGSNGARQLFNTNSLITNTKVPIYVKDSRLSFTFNGCSNLKTIVLLHLEGVTEINSAFNGCTALESITISGTIEKSIDFTQSKKLNEDSITSVINALSPNTSGLTATFSTTAVNNSFTTDGWNTLKATKSNWEIRTA